MSDKKRQKTTLHSFFAKGSKKKQNETNQPQEAQAARGSSGSHEEENLDRREETPPVQVHQEVPGPVHQHDIGRYAREDRDLLTLKLRSELLRDTWVPDENYNFPTHGPRNLRFQHKWLRRWKWLAYSQFLGGALCKYCVLFAPEGAGSGSQPLGRLVKSPFVKWKNAVEDFNQHESTKYHRDCVLNAQHLLSVDEEKVDTVEVQMDKTIKVQIEENRNRIIPVIETVILCGRQGLPLRGHRDSGPLNLDEEPSWNDGNFRALLRYRAKGGDDRLVTHMETCGKNYMYTSPKVQNEIIDSCNLLIRNELVKRINAAKCFAILADETTDIAGTEQFSLCARYVDEETKRIREDFLQFVPVYDCSGENLAKVIVGSLVEFGVNMNNLRGQGYDGAAAMSGRYNGVQTHIARQFPLAPYVHCAAHSLNLAVSDACQEVSVNNCMGTIGSVYTFLNTPKRQAVLSEAVTEKVPDASRTRLKQMCPTRWIERHDAVIVFLDLLPAVVETLRRISEWQDRISAATANQLLCAISRPEFIVTVHVISKVFSVSLPLCRLLQKVDLDLAQAVQYAVSVEDILKTMRRDATQVFTAVFTSSVKMCEDLGVVVSKPRTTARQTSRCNVPAATPEEYYRIAVFVPFVDHFLGQLQERLTAHKDLLSGFMCLIPDGTSPTPSEKQRQQMGHLVETYADDVSCDRLTALGELELWYRRVSVMDPAPKTAIDALMSCDSEIFPTVGWLLKVLATLPVSTSTSERSFSTLRRLKTYLRNTTGQERLNGLALLNIHRDVPVRAEDILTDLARKPRRLNFRL